VKNRLSPLHLVVFDLNDLRGHKIDAIAEKLGLSPATVYRLR
jgi:transposase